MTCSSRARPGRGSACGAYCPVGRSHPKRGSVSFGHTLCRHQSYGDDGLDCTAVASLCMAEVALGADTWPAIGGGGRSAPVAMVTPPTRLRRGRDAGAAESPAGSGGCGNASAALARFAPRPVVLDLSDQVSAHFREGMIKVALVRGREVSPSR